MDRECRAQNTDHLKAMADQKHWRTPTLRFVPLSLVLPHTQLESTENIFIAIDREELSKVSHIVGKEIPRSAVIPERGQGSPEKSQPPYPSVHGYHIGLHFRDHFPRLTRISFVITTDISELVPMWLFGRLGTDVKTGSYRFLALESIGREPCADRSPHGWFLLWEDGVIVRSYTPWGKLRPLTSPESIQRIAGPRADQARYPEHQPQGIFTRKTYLLGGRWIHDTGAMKGKANAFKNNRRFFPAGTEILGIPADELYYSGNPGTPVGGTLKYPTRGLLRPSAFFFFWEADLGVTKEGKQVRDLLHIFSSALARQNILELLRRYLLREDSSDELLRRWFFDAEPAELRERARKNDRLFFSCLLFVDDVVHVREALLVLPPEEPEDGQELEDHLASDIAL